MAARTVLYADRSALVRPPSRCDSRRCHEEADGLDRARRPQRSPADITFPGRAVLPLRAERALGLFGAGAGVRDVPPGDARGLLSRRGRCRGSTVAVQGRPRDPAGGECSRRARFAHLTGGATGRSHRRAGLRPRHPARRRRRPDDRAGVWRIPVRGSCVGAHRRLTTTRHPPPIAFPCREQLAAPHDGLSVRGGRGRSAGRGRRRHSSCRPAVHRGPARVPLVPGELETRPRRGAARPPDRCGAGRRSASARIRVDRGNACGARGHVTDGFRGAFSGVGRRIADVLCDPLSNEPGGRGAALEQRDDCTGGGSRRVRFPCEFRPRVQAMDGKDTRRMSRQRGACGRPHRRPIHRPTRAR